MKRKMLLVCSIVLLAAHCTVALAEPSTNNITVHSVNAECDKVDYKVTADDLKTQWEKIKPDGVESTVEYSKTVKQDLSHVASGSDQYLLTAKSYLIEHGIISRPATVSFKDGKCSATFDNDSWMSDNSGVCASDVSMMLYKATFGIIPSRTFVKQIDDDYYLYSSDSVYELYLKAAMDKGVLLKSQLDAQGKFLTEYNKFADTKPVWTETLDPTTDSSALGRSFDCSDNSIKQVEPAYFNDESMTMMDVLEMIEKYMRVTEKDMTDAEAKIVAYKYGFTYLGGLTDDEYSTAAFLIAKGIINFEDDDFSFFDDPTYADVYKLIYRVANPDARYNFSAIQLTDGEAFWQEQGFGEEDINLTFVNDDYVQNTVSVVAKDEVVGWKDFFTVHATSSIKEYTVTKDFDTVNVYKYKGTAITSICEMSESSRAEKYPEIISVDPAKVDETDVWRIAFKVKATSAKRATQIVDNRFTYAISNSKSYKISAVTKIENDGTEVRMISQKALRECFGSHIEIVEDKVLRNSDSGAMAVLLQESGYALVGNEVWANRYILVTDTSNDVYYNLDVIASLLGTEVTNMYSDSVSTTKTVKVTGASRANLYTAYHCVGAAASTDSSVKSGTVEYLTASVSSDSMVMNPDGETSDTDSTIMLYNVNQISNGMSTIWRKFKYDVNDDGTKETVIVLVDWYYTIPSLDDFNSTSWNDGAIVNSQHTLSSSFNALYSEPSGRNLQEWWQSNLGMSNALANMIFGTKRIEYVKCGYMAPRVTVLMPATASDSSCSLSSLSGMFKSFGFDMPSKYGKYINNTMSDFLESYFRSAVGFSNNDTKTFALANHRLSVIKGMEQDSGCSVFGQDFFLSNLGVLYRSTKNDQLRTYYVRNSSGKIQDLCVRSVTATQDSTLAKGSTFTYGGRKWYYAGLKTIDGRTYYEIKPTGDFDKMPTFTADKSTGDVKFSFNNKYYSSWQAQMKQLYSEYFPEVYGKLGSDKTFYSDAIGAVKRVFTIDGGLNVDDGTSKLFYSIEVDAKTGTGKAAEWKYNAVTKSYKQVSRASDAVYTTPSFFLPAGGCYVYYSDALGDYTLGVGEVGYALNQVSIYYSGIINGVIDSIISKEVETTEVKNLTNGTKLLMGDITWTKNGEYWVSEPIRNSESAAYAKNNDCGTAVAKIYGSQTITCDGYMSSMASYVKEAALGPGTVAATVTDTGCVADDGSGNPTVYTNGKAGSASDAADAVVFKIKLDDSMIVRPITSNKSAYKCCNTATESIINGMNYPFFSEDLSFTKNDEEMMALSQSSFEMTATFNQKKDEFNKEYQKKWYEDLQTLLKGWIVIAASWIMVISWFVYLTVSRGYGVRILEAVAGRNRDGKYSGLDLVKIISIGLYNLDSPPGFTRVVIVSVICVLIDAFCLVVI